MEGEAHRLSQVICQVGTQMPPGAFSHPRSLSGGNKTLVT